MSIQESVEMRLITFDEARRILTESKQKIPEFEESDERVILVKIKPSMREKIASFLPTAINDYEIKSQFEDSEQNTVYITTPQFSLINALKKKNFISKKTKELLEIEMQSLLPEELRASKKAGRE